MSLPAISTRARKTARRITAAGGEAIGLAGDLTVRAEVEKAVNTIIERWGRLDILYCGAGGFFTPAKEFANVDEGFWHLALSNTLDGLYNVAQASRPHLRGRGLL